MGQFTSWMIGQLIVLADMCFRRSVEIFGQFSQMCRQCVGQVIGAAGGAGRWIRRDRVSGETVSSAFSHRKAPRPWEKTTTGHFSSLLNGASKQAGILKDPQETKERPRVEDERRDHLKQQHLLTYATRHKHCKRERDRERGVVPKRQLKIFSLMARLIFMKSARPLKYSRHGIQSGFSPCSTFWQGQYSRKNVPCEGREGRAGEDCLLHELDT